MQNSLERIHWGDESTTPAIALDSAGTISPISMGSLIYRMREDDEHSLMLELPPTWSDIYHDAESVMTFDALVVPFGKMKRMSEFLNSQMVRAGKSRKDGNGNELTVSSFAVGDKPVKQAGTTNVIVQYALSDGQAVTVYFHNPDSKPNQLAATDDMVAWKWLLNRKDITIAVAPERGKDLNIKTVASRIMAIAEKNSPAFVKANEKKLAKDTELTGLTDEVATKKGELTTKENELADLEVQANAAMEGIIPAGYEAASDVLTIAKALESKLVSSGYTVTGSLDMGSAVHYWNEPYNVIVNADDSDKGLAWVQVDGDDIAGESGLFFGDNQEFKDAESLYSAIIGAIEYHKTNEAELAAELAKSTATPFTPTHALRDGTPVKATDEAGVYEDAEGNEHEDSQAEAIVGESEAVNIPPTLKAYREAKAANPNSFVLMRVGDFYEAFEDDAVTIASLAELTLTKRTWGASEGFSMTGFPFHTTDEYANKLANASGKKVVTVGRDGSVAGVYEAKAEEPQITEDPKPEAVQPINKEAWLPDFEFKGREVEWLKAATSLKDPDTAQFANMRRVVTLKLSEWFNSLTGEMVTLDGLSSDEYAALKDEIKSLIKAIPSVISNKWAKAVMDVSGKMVTLSMGVSFGDIFGDNKVSGQQLKDELTRNPDFEADDSVNGDDISEGDGSFWFGEENFAIELQGESLVAVADNKDIPDIRIDISSIENAIQSIKDGLMPKADTSSTSAIIDGLLKIEGSRVKDRDAGYAKVLIDLPSDVDGRVYEVEIYDRGSDREASSVEAGFGALDTFQYGAYADNATPISEIISKIKADFEEENKASDESANEGSFIKPKPKLVDSGSKVFEVGKSYGTRSIVDSDFIVHLTVASRTGKMITTTDGKRLKISIYRDVEQVKPDGSYSMAAIVSADKLYVDGNDSKPVEPTFLKEKKPSIEVVEMPSSSDSDFFNKTLKYLDYRAEKLGKPKILEQARDFLAGSILGREFNESVEDFFARNPSIKAKYDAYRAWIDGAKPQPAEPSGENAAVADPVENTENPHIATLQAIVNGDMDSAGSKALLAAAKAAVAALKDSDPDLYASATAKGGLLGAAMIRYAEVAKAARG